MFWRLEIRKDNELSIKRLTCIATELLIPLKNSLVFLNKQSNFVENNQVMKESSAFLKKCYDWINLQQTVM